MTAFPNLLIFLAFIVFTAVSYFIWNKGKALSAMLMMVGFGVSLVGWTIWLFDIWVREWTLFLATGGAACAAVGFFLTFQSQIKGDLERIRDMAKEKLSGTSDEDEAPAKAAPAEADDDDDLPD